LERLADVHIAVRFPSRAPHAAGIRGHSLGVAEPDIVQHKKLRLTSPARTWWDLAAKLTLFDLVAVGDHLLQWRSPLTTVGELMAHVDSHRGGRGYGNARAALPLLDGRAESRPESVLRVVMVLGGLPHPLINHSLV